MPDWSRREQLLAALVVLSLLLAIPGTGAFSSVTADRTATVSVATDADAYLALEPHNAANGQYATTQGDQLEIQIDDSNPLLPGAGVNYDATTTFDDVFNITNQGTQRVAVSVADNATETAYYVRYDGERFPLNDVEVVLPPGEVTEVGLVANTTDDTGALVPGDLTIEAEATDAEPPISGAPEDDRPDVIIPDRTTAAQAGVDTFQISTELSTNNATTVETARTQASAYTGVTLESLQFPQSATETVGLNIEQREGAPLNEPPLAADETVVTHFVATPATQATEEQPVTFRFRVNESVAGNPDALTVYRYDDGWSTLDATVKETATGYAVTASSPGFSTFAVGTTAELYTTEPTQPDVITAVNTTNRIDRTGDGYLSAFDLEATLDLGSTDVATDPVVSVWIDDTNAGTYTLDENFTGTLPLVIDWGTLAELERGTYDVRVDVRAGPDPTAQRLDSETLSLRLDPVAGAADPSKLNFQAETDELYRGYSEKLYSPAYRRNVADQAADRAAATLNDQLEEMISPSLRDFAVDLALTAVPGGQIIDSGLSAAETAQDVVDATIVAGNVGITIQQESTAIYLDATSTETTALRENLDALVQNSENLQTARETGNEQLEAELLVQRRELLRETYDRIPTHVDAVHQAVIEDSVGPEDRNTYAELRSHGELLRQTILADYALTTEELTGSPESLAGTQPMPTQGWERTDRAVVYDTISYPDDYTVYRVQVSEAQANQTARLRLQGNTVDSMTAFVTDEQPFTPLNATGEPLSDVTLEQVRTLQPTRTYDITAAGEYYVVVRGDNAVGQYRLSGSTVTPAGLSSDAVTIEPLTRADAPALRPGVDLIESPEPFALEETDRTVYAASDRNVSLTWELSDAETPPSELAYRYRVDRGSGFTDLSPWQTATANGTLPLELTLSEGVNRVQIVVRNDEYMQTVRSVDVVVSTFEPQAYLTTDDDVTSNALFVKVIPDRRIRGIELQYRESGTDEWTHWQNVTETTGLGRLEFPQTGYYEVRTRAISPSGVVGEWATTNLVYTGPPSVSLASAPPEVKTSPTPPVRYERVTAAERPTVAWNVSSTLTPTDELEYRTRITTGDTQSEWSAWQSVPSTGTVTRSPTLSEGTHTVEIEVRDERGRVSSRSVPLTVDRTTPTVNLTTAPDVGRGQVTVGLNERVRTLEFEYATTADPDDWQPLTTRSFVNTAQFATAVDLDPGQYAVRVRATDYAGATSDWTTATVRSLETTPNSTTEPIDETVSGGDGTDDSTTVTLSEIGESNRLDVNLISGEMIVDAYLVTRDGRREYLRSITLSAQQNQTLAVDAPGPLVADAQGMELDIRGDGVVYLDSLRAFRTTGPDPTVTTPPGAVTAATPTNLSIDTDPYVAGAIASVEWDFTNDGTIEATGPTTTHVYETPGNRTGTVTVTNVFGDAYTSNFTVPVNAPPAPAIDAVTATLTGEAVTLNGSRTADPDGSVVTTQWAVDGDTVATNTSTYTTAFDEAGVYNLSLTATDDAGATTTATTQLTVVGPVNFSDVPAYTCTGVCARENATTLIVGGTPNVETITVSQNGTDYRVSPLQNGQAIDEFYDYGNAKINSPLPIAESDRSRLFFWDGPDGLSLVVLHDEGNDGSGAAVSFDFERLPSDGSWVVKDDSGDFTTRSQVDWSWNNRKTDGGAFRGGLYDQQLTITPRFNDAARQYPLTPGRIDRWELLTGQATDPAVRPLEMDKPVTISVPPESGGGDQDAGNGTGTATWTLDREANASVTYDLVYETEQVGEDPVATVTITDDSGTTETRELAIGTAGTDRLRLDLSQFEGDVTMNAQTEATALRLRLTPVRVTAAEEDTEP